LTSRARSWLWIAPRHPDDDKNDGDPDHLTACHRWPDAYADVLSLWRKHLYPFETD